MPDRVGPRLIVALDVPSGGAAQTLVARLDPRRCRVKIGLELFTACGPGLIETLQGRGFEIFLDLKFHDIPHTVGCAVQTAAQLGVWMLNVHGLGGRRMLASARTALATERVRPKLVAVTILTSHAPEELAEIGLASDAGVAVDRLAALAAEEGLDGVVCSPHEASRLRAAHGPDFLLVTPGIRGPEDPVSDQRRTATLTEALAWGADFLVVGRPITASPDPAAALARMADAVERALAGTAGALAGSPER